jgi:hypothetical protein
MPVCGGCVIKAPLHSSERQQSTSHDQVMFDNVFEHRRCEGVIQMTYLIEYHYLSNAFIADFIGNLKAI